MAWKATLDMYGMVRSLAGGTTTDSKCNFRFPGQYEDEETGLCYNRFRYYMPSEGMYTQRDPIGLAGGNPTVYGYTWNSLTQVDPLGLSGRGGSTHRQIQDILFGDLESIHGVGNVVTEGGIDLGNGLSRFGDVVVSNPITGQITEVHQIGDMRIRGGFRPSSRERGAIMDIREVLPDARIRYHDKQQRVTLLDPDLQEGWINPSQKHRRIKRCPS